MGRSVSLWGWRAVPIVRNLMLVEGTRATSQIFSWVGDIPSSLP